MYTLGDKFLLAMRAKMSIGSTIHIQEKNILPMILLWMSSIYVIKKLLIIEIIQKIIGQKLIIFSLPI